MSFLSYLKLAQPRLPGRVNRVLDSGNAFLSVSPSLPLSSGGTTDSFFVHKRHADGLYQGAYVLFRWTDPGEQGFDPHKGTASSPEAADVEVIEQETWSSARRAIRARQALLDRFAMGDLDEGKLKELVTALEALPEDPDATLAAAVDVFAAAKELVHDEAAMRRALEGERSRLEELEERRKHLSEEQAALKREQARLAPLRSFFTDFGVDLPVPRMAGTPVAPIDIDELEARIGNVATPLVRRTSIVATLCAALDGRLLLFDGPVGTGKTTLAERVAGACGGSQAVIPVRPAWIEPADLVGYYDPLSRLFRPGPLVEALTDHPVQDRIFVTVLDELNLARIENYASDLLSRLEGVASAGWTNDQPTGVAVWSPAEWRALRAELEILGQLADTTPEQAHRLGQLRRTLRFSSRLTIPDGVAFVGTLNTDDTTYDLSPKVIDRAYAIAFPRPFFQAGHDGPVEATSALSISALRDAVGRRLEVRSRSSLWDSSLEVVNEDQMSQIGIPYSHRVFRDARVFEAVAAELGIEQDQAKWMFVFSRVLPRIRCFNNRERTDLLKGVLGRAGERAPVEDRAWSELMDRLGRQLDAGEGTVVRFWRGASD